MNLQQIFSLQGRTALITGGAGWLGSAMSGALAEAGARVAIVDIRPEAVKACVDALKAAGGDAVGFTADMMQEASIRATVDEVAAACGGLDILVNCASRSPASTLDEVTFDEMQAGFASASAYLITAQQAVQHMREAAGGSIVNIGSMYGTVTGYPEIYEGVSKPNPIAYQAGKAAIHQMTRYMAVYWAAKNIRANTLSPGPIPDPDKGLYRDNPAFKDFIGRLASKTPLGRIGRPDEFRGPVVFLASQASSYITGQQLFVDGGWTVW